MAASGITAARKEGLDGKNLSQRKGGARLHVMAGMAREATRGLGGWKSPAVMESVYTEVRSGEVVPEMRSAVAKPCNALEVTSFAEDPDRDVGSEGDDACGLLMGAAARIWCYRFTSLREFLAPEIVIPIRDNFLLLNLSDSQWRAVLLRAREFRLALRSYRNKEPASLAQVRATDAAVSSSPGKKSRQFRLIDFALRVACAAE